VAVESSCQAQRSAGAPADQGRGAKTACLHLACVCVVLLLAACGRDNAPPAETAGPPPAEAAAVTAPADPLPVDALSSVADTVAGEQAPAPPGFDQRAFAGRFTGGDGEAAVLRIAADGGFSLLEGAGEADGTWSMEPDGAHLLLDPHSKSAADQRWRVLDNDRLQRLGDAPLDLRRSP
jgi:hypothetical protein